MQIEQIVALLVAERDRLSRAIEALQGPTKRRGRSSKLRRPFISRVAASAEKPSSGSKRKLSAAGRKAIADAAKRRWAAIRAGKAVSPFSKTKGKK